MEKYMYKLHSKDYQFLVSKIEERSKKWIDYRTRLCQNMTKENESKTKIVDEYLNHYADTIKFVEKVDKELYEKEQEGKQ